MSDARLRELERAAGESFEAEQAYRLALERAGRSDEDPLRLAYLAGDDLAGERWTSARAALGLSVRQTGRTTRMLKRALYALSRPTTPADLTIGPGRARRTVFVVVPTPMRRHARRMVQELAGPPTASWVGHPSEALPDRFHLVTPLDQPEPRLRVVEQMGLIPPVVLIDHACEELATGLAVESVERLLAWKRWT